MGRPPTLGGDIRRAGRVFLALSRPTPYGSNVEPVAVRLTKRSAAQLVKDAAAAGVRLGSFADDTGGVLYIYASPNPCPGCGGEVGIECHDCATLTAMVQS